MIRLARQCAALAGQSDHCNDFAKELAAAGQGENACANILHDCLPSCDVLAFKYFLC
jgi:hypothetical protein